MSLQTNKPAWKYYVYYDIIIILFILLLFFFVRFPVAHRKPNTDQDCYKKIHSF